MKSFVLNNGIMMPALGTGTNTYGKVDGIYTGDFSPVTSAIEIGYRLFDTAIIYQNEPDVGAAILGSSVPREDFFIIGKIPNRAGVKLSKDQIAEMAQESVEHFGGYVDIYLIHHPGPELDTMLEIWSILETFLEEGKFRAIGVSNFNIEQLKALIGSSKVLPAINQIQSNPSKRQNDIIEYCFSEQIQPVAWSPLSKLTEQQATAFSDIGRKYNKSWAQVLLRYNYQRGICSIPKSHNKQRQLENISIFDFEISEEDMSLISANDSIYD